MEHEALQVAETVEITSEMTDAGVSELLAWLGDVVPESTRALNGKIVNSILQAMLSARRSH